MPSLGCPSPGQARAALARALHGTALACGSDTSHRARVLAAAALQREGR